MENSSQDIIVEQMEGIYSIDQPYDTCYISKSYDYMSHRQISFMVVDRGHPDGVMTCIKSVFELATYPEKIEMVIRIDDDDPTDIFDVLKDSDFINSYNIKIYVGKRYGFKNMHRYWNELFALTVGDILIPWGEGINMMEKGWDEELYKYRDKLYIISNETYKENNGVIKKHPWGNLSPGMTRKVYDIIGRVGPTALIDGYMDHMGGRSGIKKYTKIKALLAGDNIPNPEEQLAQSHGSTDNIRQQLEKDVNKILEYTGNKEVLPDVTFNMDSGAPYIELTGGDINKKYLVKFIDKNTGIVPFSRSIPPYNWLVASVIENADWKVVVSTEDGEVFFEYG